MSAARIHPNKDSDRCNFLITPMRLLVVAVLSVTPSFVIWLYVSTRLGYSIWNATPSWNDSAMYWHAAATFAESGFGGGYYTIAEIPPPASWSHFYAYGPMYAVLLGTVGKVLGWEAYSIPIWNYISLAIALFVYLVIARMGWIRNLVAIAICLSSSWLWMYLPSSMMEGTNHTWSVLLACLFVAMHQRTNPNWWLNLGSLAVLCFIVAYPRITWLPMLAIWLSVSFGRTPPSVPAFIVNSVLAMVFGAITYLLFQATAAPFPGTFLSATVTSRSASVSIADMLSTINIRLLNSMAELNVLAIEGGVRGSADWATRFWTLSNGVCLTAGMFLFGLWRSILRFRFERIFGVVRHILVLLALAVTFVVVPSLYGPYHASRLLSPPLIFMLLFLLATCRNVLIRMLIVVNLGLSTLVVPAGQVQMAGTVGPDYTPRVAVNNSFKAAIVSSGLMFNRDASPWCNTVFFPANLPSPDASFLTQLPAGIGVSFGGNPLLPLKSKWVIQQKKSMQAYEFRLRLDPVAEIEGLGTLSRNLDSNCGQ